MAKFIDAHICFVVCIDQRVALVSVLPNSDKNVVWQANLDMPE
jgi:hypothetical protein